MTNLCGEGIVPLQALANLIPTGGFKLRLFQATPSQKRIPGTLLSPQETSRSTR